MSLSRLALRLAAYEALCPYASRSASPAGPWPTIAGANIYDSRLDPVSASDDWESFLASIEGKPIVMLYTEEQETTPVDGEYPADKEIVDLVAELMIAGIGSVEVELPSGGTTTIGALSAPITDPQHEALLDLLEAQACAMLDPQGMLAPAAFLKIAREMHRIHSVPQRDARLSVRLAARTVRFSLRVTATQWPPPLAAGVTAPIGLAALPQPLQAVAKLINPASPAGQMLATMATLIAAPATLTPLDGLNVFVNLNRGAAPTQANGSDSDIVGFVDTTAGAAPAYARLSAWLPIQAARIAKWLRVFFKRIGISNGS